MNFFFFFMKKLKSIHELIHIENFQKQVKPKVKEFVLIDSIINSYPLEMKHELIHKSIQDKIML